MTLNSKHQEDVVRAFAVLVDSTPVGVEFDDLSDVHLRRSHFNAGRDKRKLPVAPSRAAWVVVGGFVLTILVLTPLILLRASESPEPGSRSPNSPEEILADGIVTEEEYLAAGANVVQCAENQGYEAYFLPDEMEFGTHAGADGLDPSDPRPERVALDECIAERMGPVIVAWSVHPYNPTNDVVTLKAALECTELQTGVDYGDITQDPGGNLTSDAIRTIQRLLDEAPHVYPECVRDVTRR